MYSVHTSKHMVYQNIWQNGTRTILHTPAICFPSRSLFCSTVFYVKEDLLIYYAISRCGKRVLFCTSFSTCLDTSYAGGLLGVAKPGTNDFSYFLSILLLIFLICMITILFIIYQHSTLNIHNETGHDSSGVGY